jgi:hypothetical protein
MSQRLLRWGVVAVAVVILFPAMGWAAPTVFNFAGAGMNKVSGDGTLGFWNTATSDLCSFGTASSFGAPGGSAPVLYVPAFQTTSANRQLGLQFDSGVASGNGGGTRINQYTFAFDVCLPSVTQNPYESYPDAQGTKGPYFAFFNADVTKGGTSPNRYPTYNDPNTGDADFWIWGGNDTSTAVSRGVGVSGDYAGPIADNTWTRVAVTVSNSGTTGESSTDATTAISVYENGMFVHTVNVYSSKYAGTKVGNAVSDTLAGIDGRWSLALTGAGSTYLFTDNDGETNNAYVSRVFFEDRVLSSSEIAAMGGVTFVPEPSSLMLLLILVASGGLFVWRKHR